MITSACTCMNISEKPKCGSQRNFFSNHHSNRNEPNPSSLKYSAQKCLFWMRSGIYLCVYHSKIYIYGCVLAIIRGFSHEGSTYINHHTEQPTADVFPYGIVVAVSVSVACLLILLWPARVECF